MRLGILVSGRGSNLEAVLQARPPGIEPILVISNRRGIRALDVAEMYEIPVRIFRRADFGGDASERDAAIGRALADARADLALLAGYDQLLMPSFFAAFGARTINIHPSLLPAYGGRGMMGLAVHRAVLDAGDQETGATIHEVAEELDTGPILAQARVLVHREETASALAARVLEAEHELLVTTLQRLASRA